ncbi:myo-inositol-1(or 4)-monophosphatase [Rhizobium tibeticum]|nr:myo-inositol-1(or 4)-monophosphatase [Rhizobium tibeticum]
MTLGQARGAKARSSLRRRLVGELVAKAPRDYQTEIDVAVERIIVDALNRSFPSYAIKGEEAVGNRNAKDGAPVIHIDPIDGTTNFRLGASHISA